MPVTSSLETSARLRAGSLCVLAAAVVACRLLAVHCFPIYDDAFITFRYARNLAEGAGLVFNPGAPWEPVLGTTAPAYAALLGLLHALGLPIVSASIGLNVACDVAIALFVCAALRERPLAAAVAAISFAAIPQIARISVGGMEAPLFVAIALAATLLAQSGRLGLAGAVAGIACTVRPEGAALAAVVPLLFVRSRRDALRFAAPFLALALAYVGALCVAYGGPLPQSVRAKAEESGTQLRPDRWAAILAQAFGPSLPMRLAFPLATLGFAALFLWRTRLRAFGAFALAIVLAYLAASAKTWGWYFYCPLAAWCAGLGLGSQALVDLAARYRPSWRLERWIPLAPSALAIAGVALVGAFSRAHADRVTPLVYEPLRAWAEINGIEERGARILASDIGAVGFLSGGVILDTEGLVWPEARGYASHVELMRAHRPDYVVMVANRPRMRPFVADRVSEQYEPVARFNTTGDADLHPDVERLPTWWEQDYILFRRRDVP